MLKNPCFLPDEKHRKFSDSGTEKLRNIFRYVVEINWKSVIFV